MTWLGDDGRPLQPLVIVGAGGLGLEAVQYARDAAAAGWPYVTVGLVDDAVPVGTHVAGIAVLGTSTDEHLLAGAVCVAVGDVLARVRLAARVAAAGGRLTTLVHPLAYVSPTAVVGSGSIVCPFALVGSDAVVGANVTINTHATVGHEATVGDHTVLSPYAALLGRSRVGAACYLGTRATVAPGVAVGAGSKLSLGASAMRDAAPGSLLVGNPAKGRVMFRVPDGV